MPMVDIQRRHAEAFRIRFGDKGANGAPQKLTEAIRVTAPTREIVEAFVDVYGGEVTEFTERASRDRFQAYLPTTELQIMVLPGSAMQQWWELYKGSVCDRRCDGETEQKSGRPCMCPADIDERMKDRKACSPTTRVSVLCPDVAVVGSGSFVTHGLIAAETLPQSIAVAEAALSKGLMVPAKLTVNEVRGRNHFIFPQIIITGYSLNELSGAALGATAPAGELEGERLAIESGRRPQSHLTPVPAAVGAGAPPVAEQVAQVDEPQPKAARSNRQAPLPATGVRPRTAREAADEAPATQLMTDAQKRKMHALFNEHDIKDRGDRLAYTVDCIGREVGSSNELTKAEAAKLIDELEATAGRESA
jgi:hypothetical protein